MVNKNDLSMELTSNIMVIFAFNFASFSGCILINILMFYGSDIPVASQFECCF